MRKAGVSAGMVIALLLAGRAFADDEVILKSRRFVPTSGVDEFLRGCEPDLSGRIHVILQLDDVPTVKYRVALVEAGVQLLSYIPNRAWLASIPLDRADQIASLPGVRAVAKILPEDKIAPSIREGGINAYSTAGAGQAKLIVAFFDDVSAETAPALIAEHGGTVMRRSDADISFVVCLPAAAINSLASSDAVKWIDQHYESVDLNDGVRTTISVNPVQAEPYNLTGAGVVVGQCESKHPDANHVDLTGRVVNVDDTWPVGDHATQVAGTIIGDGRLLADRRYRGMATKATLVSFHSWENVAELREQCQTAIDIYDVDIINNSWGKVEWHVYKDYTAAIDAIVRGTLGKPVPMVWAAGNEGGWGNILCTAVGKNVVTVGATNSDDNSLWSWSNKGPTEDGRIKPDVVSPGCEVRNGGAIWSTLPGNRYGGACGTSLAAPSVSGTMALVLEDWRGLHEADPLPSTLKGILIQTATDLGNEGPDYAYGYGLINAKKSIDLVRGDTLDAMIVEDRILQQSQRNVYMLDVPPGHGELRITLVWDDFPADPLAAYTLVNDLDLVVIGPSGQRRFPWTVNPYSPAEPAECVRADHTNNVEQVYVPEPAEGLWLITVWGTSLPLYDQTYSLLADTGPLTPVAPGTAVLSVTGRLGNVVAEFDDVGNLILQGGLTTGVECVPPAGAFVVYCPDQSIAGYIDPDGNMCIRGILSELSYCDPTGGGLVVTDWFGDTVACVDTAGNLCLAGRLQAAVQL